ncbi:MAG: hypothetical protein IPK82_29660 [Polyangiaceae bacterium]|nr:hypothetical protein [Polyangiaceae bacterium]
MTNVGRTAGAVLRFLAFLSAFVPLLWVGRAKAQTTTSGDQPPFVYPFPGVIQPVDLPPIPADFPPTWLGPAPSGPGAVGPGEIPHLLQLPNGQWVSTVAVQDVIGNTMVAGAPTGPNDNPGSVPVEDGVWPRFPRNGTHVELQQLLQNLNTTTGGPALNTGTWAGGGIVNVNGTYYVVPYSGGVPGTPASNLAMAQALAQQLGAPVVFFENLTPVAGSNNYAQTIAGLSSQQIQQNCVIVEPNGTTRPILPGETLPSVTPPPGNPPTWGNTPVFVGGTMVATALAYELGGPYWAGATATVGGAAQGYYYTGGWSGAASGGIVSGAGFVGGLAGSYLAVQGAQAAGVTDPTALYWIGQGGGVGGGALASGGAAAGLTYLGVPVVAGATAGTAFLTVTGVGLAAGATAVVGYHAGTWAAQYTTVPLTEAILDAYYAKDNAVMATGFTATNGGQCTCQRQTCTWGLFVDSCSPHPNGPRTLRVPDAATCNWEQGQRFGQPDGSYIKYTTCSFVAGAPQGG